MKKISFSVAALMAVGTLSAFALTPFEFAVAVRSAAGKVHPETNVEFRVDLVDTPLADHALYSEHHDATTDDEGISRLLIGEGTPMSGDFERLDWEQPLYVSLHVKGPSDTDFRSLGTTQIMSVPLAMQAHTASGLEATDSAGRTWTLGVTNSGALTWTANGGAPLYDQSKVPAELYFIGNQLNWNVAEAVPFTKVSPTLFTLDRHLVSGEIFKFTQCNYWGPLDWSGTSCKLNAPNPLREAGNTPDFGGPDGDYTLTVDFYNYTLTITPK